MNSSKNKILVWAVVMLLIINITILSAIWIMNHKQDQQKGSPADYLIKELALNTQQQKQLKALARAHHEQSEKIREKIKEARHDLFMQLRQPDVNDNSGKAAADSAAKYLEQLDLLTFDHFKHVRAICEPQQQKKFDEIIEDVLRMISSGPPPGKNRLNEQRMPPLEEHTPPSEN